MAGRACHRALRYWARTVVVVEGGVAEAAAAQYRRQRFAGSAAALSARACTGVAGRGSWDERHSEGMGGAALGLSADLKAAYSAAGGGGTAGGKLRSIKSRGFATAASPAQVSTARARTILNIITPRMTSLVSHAVGNALLVFLSAPRIDVSVPPLPGVGRERAGESV